MKGEYKDTGKGGTVIPEIREPSDQKFQQSYIQQRDEIDGNASLTKIKQNDNIKQS